MKILALPLVLFLLAGEERDHAVTLDDYFDLAWVSAVEASPDGESALFIVGRWRPELDRRNMDVWISDALGVRQLTFSPQSESDMTWHPNGKEFFFRRPAKGKSQVWRMSASGGEARIVTHAKGGVEDYCICGGGDRIYYTSKERAAVGEWGWFKKKYPKLIYGDGLWNLGRLYREDLRGDASGEPERIYGGDFHVGGFTISPDEGRAAVITTPDPRLIKLEGWSEVRIVDLEDGSARKIPDRLWREQAPSPYGWIEGVRWRPGTDAVAFTVSWDGYPTEIYLASVPRQGEIEVVKIPRPDGPEVAGGSLQWGGPGGELYFRAQVRTLGKLCRIRFGSPEMVPTGDGDISAYSVSGDGSRIYMVRNLLDRHQDVYSLPASSDGSLEPTRLTDVDPQVDRWILPETRIVTWKGWNDDEVEGVLTLPAGWDGKEPLPTAVMIHGGPGAASLSVLNYWMSAPVPLYAARGWAVFQPNYRGSIGYGDRFHSELIGHKNDRDAEDILAGVQHLVEEGIADPDRLAVNGWSNGGSLTNWLVVAAPDRFRAAASGAGVADFTFQFGLEDTPGHVINYSEGFPWETWESLMRRSPLANADRVRTPVLFLVGEKDERVPAAHARAFHRSLRYVGVPTEMIIFPGEGHGLEKMSHRRAKMEMELLWFEKYVLGETGP